MASTPPTHHKLSPQRLPYLSLILSSRCVAGTACVRKLTGELGLETNRMKEKEQCCGSGSAWISIHLAVLNPDLHREWGSGTKSMIMENLPKFKTKPGFLPGTFHGWCLASEPHSERTANFRRRRLYSAHNWSCQASSSTPTSRRLCLASTTYKPPWPAARHRQRGTTQRQLHQHYRRNCCCRVSDPHWFNADPDTDPDPAFSLIADPDSGSGSRTRIQGLMT